MLLKRKHKYAFTDRDWNIQREMYVSFSAKLNPEFEYYKRQRQAIRRSALCFTLEYIPDNIQAQNSLRLPHGYRQIRILSGRAWVAYRGKDCVLKSGEELHFSGDSQDAIVSALRSISLVFAVIP